ncbi:8-amino-7-oxononanoate synthase [Caballeronia sp. ATUFL_F1_KS39]|uniref:8-amino-7-oxononanoate synthase n=1 Tax=Caballeronia sp. ATUFL_F1_KS39 TaxID=2921766 RepID=UPI0020293983|nr:8-amino-7-oxononanoate synthase [Caballeronia sp. ATUFL_F1_KS39]
MVAPSTLHLSIDVIEWLGGTHALLADEALYPVLRWGLQRVMGIGVPVRWFRHGDPADLAQRMRQQRSGLPPAIIVDATSAAGEPAPVARYVALARRRGGLVAIDQSQVLGLFGHRPSASHPWGMGGGGLLPYTGIGANERVLLIASWAKAFGAPLATLCGPTAIVGAIARTGPTQSHCSAACEAALHAALNAMAVNRRDGEVLRAALIERIARLESGLRTLAVTRLHDLRALRRGHPLQQFRLGSPERTRALHASLRAQGIRTALLQQESRYAIAVVVRANHSGTDIDALMHAMASLAHTLPRPAVARAATRSLPMEEFEHV